MKMELFNWCRIFFSVCVFISVAIAKPAKEPQYGPEAGMDYMHGVMMHGDSDAGEDHKNEDTYLRLQAADTEKAKQAQDGVGPCIGGDCAHELMHNEGDDVQKMDQKSAEVETDNTESGPVDAMKSLHGVMMHGDEDSGKDHDKDHEKMAKPEEDQDAPGVKDAMDEMHGVLMHGDTEQGVDHAGADLDKTAEDTGKERPETGVESAHQFMHGDDDSKHIHNDDPKMDVGPRGVPSVGDPHEAIHGDLNAQLQLDDGDENTEAKRGKEDNTGGKADDDANFLGFSFPFISDSFLDEIELLKKKWLPKNWSSDEELPEIEQKLEKDSSNTDTDTDLLHDLAGVGDTGPSSEQGSHHHDVPENKKKNPKHDES